MTSFVFANPVLAFYFSLIISNYSFHFPSTNQPPSLYSPALITLSQGEQAIPKRSLTLPKRIHLPLTPRFHTRQRRPSCHILVSYVHIYTPSAYPYIPVDQRMNGAVSETTRIPCLGSPSLETHPATIMTNTSTSHLRPDHYNISHYTLPLLASPPFIVASPRLESSF